MHYLLHLDVALRFLCLINHDFTIYKVFQLCDESKKGYLNREDMKMAVVMLFGYKPSKVIDVENI